MPNILIRNVSEHVHARLTARAKAAGMSLQQFCMTELEKTATAQSPQEAVADIRAALRDLVDAGQSGFGQNGAASVIRELRGDLPDA
jgi:hypothetical protein